MNQNFNNQRDPLPRFDTAEPNFGNDSNNDRAPLPEYTNDGQVYYSDPAIEANVEDNFKMALASLIMSMFPVTSIVAIFLSFKSWRTAWDIDDAAKNRRVRVPGKNIASKILSAVGKGYSIFCSIFYPLYFVFLFAAILSEM